MRLAVADAVANLLMSPATNRAASRGAVRDPRPRRRNGAAMRATPIVNGCQRLRTFMSGCERLETVRACK